MLPEDKRQKTEAGGFVMAYMFHGVLVCAREVVLGPQHSGAGAVQAEDVAARGATACGLSEKKLL